MLTVFNVGQGDSFLLCPDPSLDNFCEFSATPLLIDTGPSCAKVGDKFIDQEISVLLTHSDNDHKGGLAGVVRKKQVKNLYVPYYLPEIIKICGYLKENTVNKTKPLNWTVLNKLNIRLVSERKWLCCDHVQILNPPEAPSLIMGSKRNKSLSLDAAFGLLSNLGIELPKDEIKNYKTPIDERFLSENPEYAERSRAFVHRFFTELAGSLDDIEVSKENVNYYVNRKLELTANDASLVFRYERSGVSWLFTGDASQAVFDRLIAENKNISANFLKVPHHGSAKNLTDNILRKINPKYAIVSHNNRKFGRALEAHPASFVIDMLDAAGVETFYTNPVIKNGKIIKKEAVGKVCRGLIEFV